MARYRTTLQTRRDLESTFSYLSDFTNARQWDPGVTEVRRDGSDAIQLGTTFHLVASFLGRRVPLDYVITVFEAPRRVQLSAQSATIRSIDTMTFTAVEGGTEVTYDALLQGLGALRYVDALLNLLFHRVGTRAREGLIRELNR